MVGADVAVRGGRLHEIRVVLRRVMRATYAPARPGTLIWWWVSLATRPFVRASASVRSGEEDPQVASHRAIEHALGAHPELRHREQLLGYLTNSAAVLAIVCMSGSALLGVLVDSITGSGIGMRVARGVGAAVGAPFGGLAMVWAIRWAVSRRDLARRRRPTSASQPAGWDLLLALPVALPLGCFLLFV